ncbi:MAG TPA: Ig-like domain-containing protein, partial [Polyangia bacterium]
FTNNVFYGQVSAIEILPAGQPHLPTTTTPVCADGPVAAECKCGAAVVATGYCCAGMAQTSACDTTAPTISLTAPAAGATVSGSVNITASAADNVGVIGVQFKLDGANLAAEDTTSPYSVSWATTTATDGPHTLTAVARDAAGNQTIATGVTVTVANGPPPSCPAGDTCFYVAPGGVLGNPGTVAAPTTLEGARTLVQNASRANPGTLRVILRGGLYSRSATFTLGAADSGSAANPVVYAAYPNETPRLIGGAALPPAALHLVDGTDPNWSRLDPATRSQIYVADLTAYAASLGNLTSRSDAGGFVNQALEVFADGVPLTLARYPKAVDRDVVDLAPHATIRVTGSITPDATGDYAYKGLDSLGRPYYQLAKGGNVWSIAASATSPDWRLSNRPDLGGTGSLTSWGTWDTFAGPAGSFAPLSGAAGLAFLAPADGSSPVPGFLLIRGTNGTTQITAPDSHLSRWRASEAMYFGLGYYSWSGSHSGLASLDPVTGSLVLAGTPTYGLRAGQPFFVYNLLEELTAPGEYFIDRGNARLYLRPAGDVPPAEVLLSTLQTPIVQMYNCQWITWQGVTFEADRDRLVYANVCQNVAFRNCSFRNAGGDGLLLIGSANLVEACDFRHLGKGGVYVSGGSRTTLTPSGTLVENCEMQRFGRLFWTYQPGINIDYTSMGITVQHNEIHHSPHAAILYGGNANTMRYNHIHDVTQWTNDAGAIYTTGRDWGTQGNVIQFNLIRHCGSPLGVFQSGIYIDGVGSGVKLEGNILYHAAPMFAIQHNGGRDVVTQYNIMSGHWYGVDISNVAFEVVNHTAGSSWDLLGKLIALNYQSPPWSTTYPNVAQIPNDWSLIQGSHWLEPEGSVCYGNLQQGLSPDLYHQHNSWPSLGQPVSYFSQVGANLSQVDPLFTDPAKLDFRLQPASPMFTVPGFPGIDVARIGIQH